MPSDIDFLKIALMEAATRRGFTAPNPAVGAVVVKDGKILSTGFHFAPGHPHAEVDALSKIGDEATGATLYVTLEPCCHHGRTPPCTELILSRGIVRVVYGYKDPNPAVAGKGATFLIANGIACELISIDTINDFYRAYQFWWDHHRPFVTLKIALSADGKIAGKNGTPVEITGETCRVLTHQHRKASDAILTSVKTIINDDPQLNVRLDQTIIKRPIYVLDRQLQFPLNARLAKTAESVTLFCSATEDLSRLDLLQRNNIRCIPVSCNRMGLNLENVLDHIGKDGVHALWVEAGGRVFQAFFKSRLAQRALIYASTKELGPEAQPAFTESFDILRVSQDIQWKSCGDDLVADLRL